MSDLKKILVSLSTKYNDSPKILSTTLENIFKEITREKCIKRRNIAVISVYSSICTNLETAGDNKYNILLKFMQDSFTILECNYRSLKYIEYFIHYSLKENKITEIRKLLINFKLQPSDSEDSLKLYFHIHTFYYSRIIFFHQPTKIEVKSFFGNLLTIFQITYKVFPAQFLEFSEEILGKLDYINLILTHPEYSKDFLKTYLQILSSLNNITNLNNLYVHLTTIFIYFYLTETSKQCAVNISKTILKACLESPEIQKNKLITYNLSINYDLINLLDENNNNQQQQIKFREVLQKYKIFLERKEINEIWFKDGIVTFIEQIFRISQQFAQNTSEDNCELIFTILESILKFLYDIKSFKKICPKCNCNTIHQIYNLCSIALNFYQRVITLNLITENIDKFVFNIFRISLDCKKKFNCKRSDVLLSILVQDCYKYIKNIKNVKRIKYGLAILDLITKSSELQSIGIINALKLYQQYYEIIQHKKKLPIIQALTILNLTSDVKYYPYINSSMHNFIKYLLDANMKPNTFICDVIPDTEAHLKPKISNISYILQEQIDILAQKKLLTPEEFENFVLKAIDKINSHLEFAILVRKVNIITDKELLDKVKNVIESITNNLNKCKINVDKFKYHYVLGILYKREAMQLFEELKNYMNWKSFNSDSIKELISAEFDKFNIKTENSAINIALLSIKHFSCILPYLNDEKNLKLINWIYLFDDISILARQFELRGYINHGYTAWKLLYKIATDNHNCDLERMRATSYFCKYFQLINMLDKNLNLKIIIDSLSHSILENFKNIDSLTPRRQNYVLSCILDIAYFYVEKNDIKSCNALMNLILNKLNKMESRQNNFELVRAKLCALEFHVVTKFPVVLNQSPYLFIGNVLNEIRNIQYITSEDSINIVIFLFNFIQEIVYYFMSMNDINNITVFVMMIAKYALDSGLILQIIQILLLWAHMNLEKEECEECQMKIVVVNKLMLIQNDLKIEYSPNKNNNTANTSVDIFNISDNNMLTVKQTRDIANNNSLLPSNMKLIISPSKKCLDGHLNAHSTHCNCESCKQPLLRMIQFKIGCLNARMLYLDDKTNISEEYFEKSLNWWKTIDSDFHKVTYSNFKIWLLIYYINSLRFNKQYYKGIEICKYSLHYIKNSVIKFDLGYYWKIIEQKEAIIYNLSEIETVNVTPKKNLIKSNLVKMRNSILDKHEDKKEDENLLNDKIEVCTNEFSQLKTEENISINKKRIKINGTEDVKHLNTNVARRKQSSQVKVLQQKNENTTANTGLKKQPISKKQVKKM